MKTFGYIVLGILVLLIAAVVVVPSIFDLNDYKAEIAALVKETTGRELAIDGDIDLTLLPLPTIKVNGVRFANLEGAAVPDMVRIGVIEASVAIAPLFSGNIEVGSLTFVEPVIELEVLADGRANWRLAIAGDKEETSGDGAAPSVSVDSLVVENATLVFRDGEQGTVERIERLTFEAAVGSINGPFSAEGSLVARGLPLAFAANVGRLDRRPVSVRLSLGLSGTSATLDFNGAASSAAADATLMGKLTIAGDSLARVIAAVGGGGADNPFLAHGFSLKARVAASAATAGINDIAFDLGGVQGTGAASIVLANGPQIDAAIALNHVDLDQLFASAAAAAAGAESAPAGPAAPFALPRNIFATLDLRINAVVFNQAVVRQAQLVAALDRGVLTLQLASALLPGGSDVTVFGVLDAPDGKPRFTGQIEASVDNLRAVFAWLDVAPSGVPADRLRKLSLSSAFEVTPSLAKVSAIDLRVDSSRLTGGVNIGLGARPAFNAIVALDHINLDAYLPPPPADAESDAAPGDPFAVLGAFDAELKAQVGKLVYNAVPMSDIRLDAGLRNGVLTVRSLSVADLAGARVALAGRVDAAKPEFDVSYDIRADDAARLFQLAAVARPGHNLGGAIVRGTAKGDLDAVTLDTTVVLSDAEASFAGALTGLADMPRVDARISLRADSLAGLARRFGAALPPAANTPVVLEGEIKGDAAAATVALTASVLGADARIDGGLTNLMAAPAYDLALALDHADFVSLAESLAEGVSFAHRDLGGVELRARIAGNAFQAQITELQAVLGPAQFSGTIAARFDGPRPSLDADIAAGDIYVDLLLPAGAASGTSGGTGTSASTSGNAPGERWSCQPIDLSGLRAADARARITATALNVRNYRFEDVSLRLTLADGVLDIEDLSGQLYGAPAKLRARLADTTPPTARLELILQGADLKALLIDVAGVDAASGHLELTGQFQTRGRSELELVSALAGQATFKVRQGAVAGIDLGRLNSQLTNIDNEIALIGLLDTAMTGGTTPIHSLEGTFVAEGGVLRSTDLHAVLEGGEGRATATVDLPRWQLAMNSEFHLTGHPNAPPIGLLLMGPIDDPRREIRGEALQAHIMEKAIGSVVRKLAPGATDELGAAGALIEGLLGGGQSQQQAPAEDSPPAEQEQQQLFENLLESLIQGN